MTMELSFCKKWCPPLTSWSMLTHLPIMISTSSIQVSYFNQLTHWPIWSHDLATKPFIYCDIFLYLLMFSEHFPIHFPTKKQMFLAVSHPFSHGKNGHFRPSEFPQLSSWDLKRAMRCATRPSRLLTASGVQPAAVRPWWLGHGLFSHGHSVSNGYIMFFFNQQTLGYNGYRTNKHGENGYYNGYIMGI